MKQKKLIRKEEKNLRAWEVWKEKLKTGDK